jgi:hypothetical protein
MLNEQCGALSFEEKYEELWYSNINPLSSRTVHPQFWEGRGWRVEGVTDFRNCLQQ